MIPTTVHRPRPPGAGLSESRIVDAAMALVIEEGVEGLSMRRLAAILNVTPMALYRHVADKRALEGLLAGRISQAYYRDLVLPKDATWQETIRSMAQIRADLNREHPEMLKFGSLLFATEWNLAATNRLLAALLEDGLSDQMAIRVARTVQLIVTGGEVEAQADFGPNLPAYPIFARLHDAVTPQDLDPLTSIELFIQLLEIAVASTRVMTPAPSAGGRPAKGRARS